MLHVCCQERHFRTPAAHSVNAAERPSVYLCFHPPTPLPHSYKHSVNHTPANHQTDMHAYSHTRKPIPNTSADACRYSRPLKKQTDRCWFAGVHTYTRGHANEDSTTYTPTLIFISIHDHTPNSGQIVYRSIGSLNK